MLKKVLREIKDAKVLSLGDISEELNITEAMVEAAIDQLDRMGYIVEDMGSPTCETKCSGCTLSSCNTIPLKTVTITDKGRKLLENH